jgi:hypothetical protein
MMDFNQAIVALGFKPITYPSRQKKENKLQAGMRRIEDKLALFNKMILRGDKPQVFINGQWAQPQVKAVNRVKALEAKQDVYFTPNHFSGARRAENAVDSLRNFFIDMDAGKDANGNYLPLDVVAERKKEMWKQILAMPKYTAVVETRNGYHVYWAIKLSVNISLAEWKVIQARIVELTGADEKVKSAAGLLRLPYTFWMKANKGKYDTYLTRIVDVTTEAYTPHDLLKWFEKQAGEVGGNNITVPTVREVTSSSVVGAEVSQQVLESNKDNIAAIKRLDPQPFKSLFVPQPQRMTGMDTVAYLKSNINLKTITGLPDRFSCIFHDDRNPSASIFKDSASGHWLYKCHSSNCSYADQPMDIIDVVKAIAGVGFNAALKFLVAAFNITLPSNKKGRHIDQMITSNVTALQTIASESEAYQKKLAPIMDVYKAFTQIARETAEKTNTIFYGSDVYFAASTRFLADKLGASISKIFPKTVLLAALELVEKVADDNLPEKIILRDFLFTHKIATCYGDDRTIQYYRLPAIDTLSAMTKVKKNLDKWIAGKGQIKNINERLIAGIFGYDVAAAIYSKKTKKEANTTSANVVIA